MGGWALAVVLACAGASGCNQVFGLKETTNGTPCWQTERGSGDEGGDGVVDGCDVCPGIADADQANEDEDGAGDACDPHPDDPRDRIAFFDGFAGATLDARWLAYPGEQPHGMWVQADGVVRQVVPDGYSTLILNETFDNATIETVMSGQEQLDISRNSIHGVIMRIPPDTEMGFPQPALYCFSYEEPISMGTLRILVQEGQPGETPKSQVTIQPGARTRLRQSNLGICEARVDEQPNARTEFAPLLAPVAGEIALRTARTVGTFEYVTVYVTDP